MVYDFFFFSGYFCVQKCISAQRLMDKEKVLQADHHLGHQSRDSGYT